MVQNDALGEDSTRDEPTFQFVDEPGSNTLIVTFAVFPRAGGKSSFDFVRATTPIPAKKLYVRDSHMMWYQKGTPGVGESVPEVAEFVRRVVEREKVKRIVVIGNSGGAFAAIMFGAMIGADDVQAFNPPIKLYDEDDTSFPDQLEILKAERGLESPFLDLRKVLEQYPSPRTSICVHYSRGDKRDRIHAALLSRFANVRLIEYPMVTHHLALYYTRRGWLTPLLYAAAVGDDVKLEQTIRKVRLYTLPAYPIVRSAWFFQKVWGRLARAVHRLFR